MCGREFKFFSHSHLFIAIGTKIIYNPLMTGEVLKPYTKQSVTDSTLWEPRHTLTLDAARRHTRHIKFLRYIFLSLAALLVLVLIYQFSTQSNTTIVQVSSDQSVKILNPRYSGRTLDDLPFRLTAESAVRQKHDAAHVALDKPIMYFFRQDGADQSIIISDKGRYNDEAGVLNLHQNVDLKTDDGNHCVADHARFFTQDKRIKGDEPIKCVGEFGFVEGQSYEILESYSVFVFDNNMHAILKPEDGSPQSLGDAGQDALSALSASRQDFGFGREGHVDVRAKKATYKGSYTFLEKNVDVKQGDERIQSDSMEIFRQDETQESAQSDGTLIRKGQINKIDARGNFIYSAPDNIVSGDRGIYLRERGLITVTGNVVLTQPSGSQVLAERMIYDLNKRTVRFGQNCLGKNCQNRVSMELR